MGSTSNVGFPFACIYGAVLRKKTLYYKPGLRRFGDPLFSYISWDT